MELDGKLRQLLIEDYIWVLYVGIILLSWYSNSLERKYFLYNDLKCKSKYRDTLIIIFSILLVIYTYFLKSSINDIKKLKCTDSYKKKKLVYTSFLASLLFQLIY